MSLYADMFRFHLGWTPLIVRSDLVDEAISFLRSSDANAPNGSSFAWTAETANYNGATSFPFQRLYVSSTSLERLSTRWPEYFVPFKVIPRQSAD